MEESLVQGIGKENLIYTHRFSESEQLTRDLVWQVLTQQFFQRYIRPEDTVVDIGAGDGCFLKNIKAKRKIAVDLSEHVQALSRHDIEVHQVPATACNEFIDGKADVIFMSNFLEHLPNKQMVLTVFESCCRLLKPGGKFIILQPNIKFVGPAYWDYIDHHIALNENSIVEGLENCGFQVQECIDRFLPYTVRSKVGRLVSGTRASLFTKIYLKFPLLWRFFGGQTFVVATPVQTG